MKENYISGYIDSYIENIQLKNIEEAKPYLIDGFKLGMKALINSLLSDKNIELVERTLGHSSSDAEDFELAKNILKKLKEINI